MFSTKSKGQVLSVERIATRVAALVLLVLAGLMSSMAPASTATAFGSLEFPAQDLTVGHESAAGAGGIALAVLAVGAAILFDMSREVSVVKNQ
mmetsp:Transcript_41308/g.87513  ORF Transcript_41308/g.87513 Transcript_41308/m.87513 type:complete len:93 (+) Transcript_41308:566-844(+)